MKSVSINLLEPSGPVQGLLYITFTLTTATTTTTTTTTNCNYITSYTYGNEQSTFERVHFGNYLMKLDVGHRL
jgi:hypothetical protein